ncbi:MAG: hypothetical protein QXP54_02195 [Thermofilum sp.]
MKVPAKYESAAGIPASLSFFTISRTGRVEKYAAGAPGSMGSSTGA